MEPACPPAVRRGLRIAAKINYLFFARARYAVVWSIKKVPAKHGRDFSGTVLFKLALLFLLVTLPELLNPASRINQHVFPRVKRM